MAHLQGSLAEVFPDAALDATDHGMGTVRLPGDLQITPHFV